MSTTVFNGSHGRVEVKPGKGRMRGRFCVIGKKHKIDPRAKGIKKSPLLLGGCFNDKSKALARGKKLAGSSSAK